MSGLDLWELIQYGRAVRAVHFFASTSAASFDGCFNLGSPIKSVREAAEAARKAATERYGKLVTFHVKFVGFEGDGHVTIL